MPSGTSGSNAAHIHYHYFPPRLSCDRLHHFEAIHAKRMRLRHLPVPGIISYHHASAIQQRIVTSFLQHKAAPHGPPPDPVIVTFQCAPTYTCGRREVGTVSPEQQAYLRAEGKAEFAEALRGGQTTFHGPGQLVAYPIIDLKRHGLTPRTYVCLLEKSLIKTCGDYGISAMTTEHTGVWTTPEKKIAAIGIHLRRNISSHGVGLNVNTDLWWFDRIVACGLEGKKTTSFTGEGVTGIEVPEVAEKFVSEIGARIGHNQIDIVGEEWTKEVARLVSLES